MIEELAYIIQNSRCGEKGRGLTEFRCKFCGEVEIWGDIKTPGICERCAEEMASKIIENENLLNKLSKLIGEIEMRREMRYERENWKR